MSSEDQSIKEIQPTCQIVPRLGCHGPFSRIQSCHWDRGPMVFWTCSWPIRAQQGGNEDIVVFQKKDLDTKGKDLGSSWFKQRMNVSWLQEEEQDQEHQEHQEHLDPAGASTPTQKCQIW